ncbi:NAD(P)/FAD-dependent oxidoreductase [Nocardioides bigeumensis]|uniref:Phytoene desaturase family protein n=1 Tax=Nocardioides bigeumensis TaxID=433657 RepID=A0ABN2XXL7_9ACTN
MRVAVIGGGFGGLASAARLAKLGHDVILLERGHALGGALAPVQADGFTWDGGPTATLLPAVLRDLFRKTGRPLERELELLPLEVARRHRFADKSAVDVPVGSRSAQARAFDGLGAGLGDQWTTYADSFTTVWEVVRRELFERPYSPDLASRELTALLRSREMLSRRTRKALRDPRLRLVATHEVVAGGHEPRDVPAWLGMTTHLEQRLGTWTVAGGLAALGAALGRRLETRGVDVLTGAEAHDVVVRGGRVVAVATGAGHVDCDAVVCCIDPRRLTVLAEHVRRTQPALPPTISHLGLAVGDAGHDLPHEVVLHGDPMLVLRTGGRAPDGGKAWTIHGHGRLAEDIVVALARAGIDVRDRVVTRVDLSPRDLVEQWGGSPMGVRWAGRRTVSDRLGPRTPVPGVYAAGAHATSGPGLPFVGLSAALVAQVIGPA